MVIPFRNDPRQSKDPALRSEQRRLGDFSLRSESLSVLMLVRSEGLAESMSQYLIRRIEENPAIDLRTRTEIVGLEG